MKTWLTMIATIVLAMLAHSAVGAETASFYSTYNVHTETKPGKRIIETDERLDSYCHGTEEGDPEAPYYEWTCGSKPVDSATWKKPAKDDMGTYTVSITGGDHGYYFELFYGSKNVTAPEYYMQLGKTYEYKLGPDFQDIVWADWGVANGVFEWRYRKGETKPFALIYRHNFTSLASNQDNTDGKVASVSSSFIIYKLDGEDTELYGFVDSIAAWETGKNANEYAQQCADSILKGDPASYCVLYDQENGDFVAR